jgi:hypothetical protein
MRHLLIRLALAFLPTLLPAGNRLEPESWILWRAAPIPFPDEITPLVPELMQGAPPLDFGPKGTELTIVLPDNLAADYDDRALLRTKELIVDKVPGAKVVTAAQVTPADCRRHLLLLGTAADHPLLAKLPPATDVDFTRGIAPGGYRLAAVQSPFAPNRSVILALGADRRGAWAAGIVLAHAIHPDKPGVNVLHNWPVAVPSGCYWLPFSARSSPPAQPFEVTGPPQPAPPPPAVLFAVRVWGSPMPTLPSYQRLIRALKPTGINAVVIQSGGWVDLPDAAEIFAQAVDIAWQEGIYTILYAGNEEIAHVPAPLTENHRRVVLATKDRPGLLAYHLYNQLAAKLTPAQQADLRSQMEWMKSVTTKPVGMEIVWGHRTAEIPADKQQLMRDLKSQGLGRIATDYAPIGGWTDVPYLPMWEKKLLALRPFEPEPDAVLQAHVPFLEATVPSREQLRNQFWWAVAGGAHGFMVETAFLPTHYSMRGLLSWDLHPLPDGRYDELASLTRQAEKLREFITATTPATEAESRSSGLTLRATAVPSPIHLRMRAAPEGGWYALLINENLASDATATLATHDMAYAAQDVLGATSAGTLRPDTPLRVTVPRAGAVCLRLKSISSP